MLLFKIAKQTGTCVDKMCGNKLTRSAKNEVGLFSLT